MAGEKAFNDEYQVLQDLSSLSYKNSMEITQLSEDNFAGRTATCLLSVLDKAFFLLSYFIFSLSKKKKFFFDKSVWQQDLNFTLEC